MKPTGSKAFSCSKCGESVSTKCSLNRHVRIHDAKAKTKACLLCNYRTSRADTLTRHIKKKHKQNGGNKPRTCLLCNYSTDKDHLMTKHVTSVHKVPSKSQQLEEMSAAMRDTGSTMSSSSFGSEGLSWEEEEERQMEIEMPASANAAEWLGELYRIVADLQSPTPENGFTPSLTKEAEELFDRSTPDFNLEANAEPNLGKIFGKYVEDKENQVEYFAPARFSGDPDRPVLSERKGNSGLWSPLKAR